MGLASLVQDIVYRISGRVLSSSGLYVPSDYQYDYALGGIPFLSAASDTRPDLEGPIEQRKQQFDNQKDPGEYSLNQWWLRSQSSFIGGAGVVYQDPDTQGESRNLRYANSVGVDPFTDPDNIQLLHEVNESTEYVNLDSSVGLGVEWFDQVSSTIDGNVWLVDFNGNVNVATVNAGDILITGSATIPSAVLTTQLETYSSDGLAPSFDDTPYLYAYSDDSANGGLWKVNSLTLATSRVYSRAAFIGSLPVNAMSLSRGLIYINIGSALYSLDPNATPTTAWPATPVATVPANQEIISITDGPDAIYVAANDEVQGYIYKSTFDSNGVVNGLTQIAVLPLGERINCIAAYVATYMVITTMTTVRVATFTGAGLSYGPPLITVPIEAAGTPGIPGLGFNRSGFGKIAFYGTRAYFTVQSSTSQHDGAWGTMAIDLGVVINDNNTGSQTNAYSTWVYSPLTTRFMCDLAVTKTGRIIYTTVTGSGPFSGHLWLEHKTNLVGQGYLDTGRCRFNTIEPKLFKYISVRTDDPLRGEITVAVLDQGGGVTTYVTYGESFAPGTEDVPTPVPTGPQNWIALRFTLRRDADEPELGPKLDSWQIKALPGTLKQRRITRQFLCFNSEKDKTGAEISGDTQSLDKLTAVRQMCQRGDTVTFQDLTNNISDQVVIDDYQFTMLAPPGPNSENYGGYLTVVMRTVADSVPALSLAGTVEEE